MALHYSAPRRRRIYLMRHGRVTYFTPDGRAVDPLAIELDTVGQAQADAAGALFAHHGVRFDRVICSGLARTRETARRVLAASEQRVTIEDQPVFEEIRGGRLSDIPADQIIDSFLGVFAGPSALEQRFLGGESVGELQQRVLPAFAALRQDPDWDVLLLVLHGGVNRALLSYALSGGPQGDIPFYGGLAQAPACINAIDVGDAPHDWIVRAMNVAPTDAVHLSTRKSTMEILLEDYLAYVHRG